MVKVEEQFETNQISTCRVKEHGKPQTETF